MKNLSTQLKKHHYAIFLDFEGTQFSHEMIAIGAQVCSLGKNYEIITKREPFKIYVKAKNKIGSYVSALTGIKDEQLNKEGVDFPLAMKKLKDYCGLAFNDASFITFGSHDMRILGESIAHNINYPKEICQTIQKNNIDFQKIISEFSKDKNGNPLSLIHYLELFGIKEEGLAHDPQIDAMNLANLYQAFISKKEFVLEQYLKILQNLNHYPDPIKNIMKKLASGEDVTSEELKEEARKYIS